MTGEHTAQGTQDTEHLPTTGASVVVRIPADPKTWRFADTFSIWRPGEGWRLDARGGRKAWSTRGTAEAEQAIETGHASAAVRHGKSVYIIECTSASGRVTLHVGIARDVPARVAQHSAGRVKATRGREVKLLGYSPPMAHGDALRMEHLMKRQPPSAKREQAARWRCSESA